LAKLFLISAFQNNLFIRPKKNTGKEELDDETVDEDELAADGSNRAQPDLTLARGKK
jgi:hypothetical protein